MEVRDIQPWVTFGLRPIIFGVGVSSGEAPPTSLAPNGALHPGRPRARGSTIERSVPECVAVWISGCGSSDSGVIPGYPAKAACEVGSLTERCAPAFLVPQNGDLMANRKRQRGIHWSLSLIHI